MSYAEVAASSGPTGSPPKIPEVAQVERTDDPNGNVSVIDQESADKIKGEYDEKVEKAKKKLNKAEKEGKDKLKDYEASIKKYYQKFSSAVASYTSSFAARSQKEVQNPVVVSQIVVCLGAVSAAYIGFLERGRILNAPHFKSAVTAHAAIITGFVLLDGFLFNKYYSKYDKK